METAMVTGRMTPQKKEAGNAILKRAGLNASQAINRLYDRLIEERDAAFIQGGDPTQADRALALRHHDEGRDKDGPPAVAGAGIAWGA